MSGCCSDDDTKKKKGTSALGCCSEEDVQEGESVSEEDSQDAPSKSFIGRFLYNMGKKDFEKNKGKSKGGGCC